MDAQTSLFDMAAPAPPDNSAAFLNNDPDAFGCCSRFRSCSDEKRCLISQLEYSSHCSYRKNLESGKIFYGKNAVDFSPAEYSRYSRCINALSPDVLNECYRLLIYFCEVKPGSRRVLIDNAPWLRSLSDTGLFSIAPCHDYLLSACGYRELLNHLKSDPIYGPKWAAREDNDRTKKALVDWIKGNAGPFLDRLADPYRMIELSGSARIYAIELYYDFLFNRSFNFNALPSPLVRDGLTGKVA